MGAGLFWGLLLVVLGLSLIIRIVFNIHFPLFRIVLAFIFIYIGIRILFGSWSIQKWNKASTDTIFQEKRYTNLTSDKEYNVIFGKATYDLRDIHLTDNLPLRLKINTIFGATVLRIYKDTPVSISVNAAFGGAKLPNGNTTVLGTSKYESDNYRTDSARLELQLDVVFGGVDLEYY